MGKNLTREEFEDQLEFLEAFLVTTQRRHYRSMFPGTARQQVDRLWAIAQEWSRKAEDLEREIEYDVIQREEIEKKIFTLAFTIERLKTLARKGPVSSKQLKMIQKIAKNLSIKIKED